MPIVIGALGTILKRFLKGLVNKRKSGDHIDYKIVKISQNTKESLGDLRRLAVT